MSGSNPPSTSGSPCIARRAITTSAAVAVLAVALPVVLVAAIAAFASNATAASAPEQAARAELVVARSASLATPADIQVPTVSVAPTTTTTAAAPATTVAPPPPPTTASPAPQPAERSTAGDPNDPASWERLAQCESGGNWATNTGNGYYGGIQFSLASWRNVGGTGYPHEASKETQIEMGKRLYAQGGWGHWPGCTRSFGWT